MIVGDLVVRVIVGDAGDVGDAMEWYFKRGYFERENKLSILFLGSPVPPSIIYILSHKV